MLPSLSAALLLLPLPFTLNHTVMPNTKNSAQKSTTVMKNLRSALSLLSHMPKYMARDPLASPPPPPLNRNILWFLRRIQQPNGTHKKKTYAHTNVGQSEALAEESEILAHCFRCWTDSPGSQSVITSTPSFGLPFLLHIYLPSCGLCVCCVLHNEKFPCEC